MKIVSSVLLLFIFSLILSGQVDSYESWYQFRPNNNLENSLITLDHWLHKPAGKYGFIKSENDKLILGNGSTIKLWGVNICSARPFSEQSKAEAWANILAKYGVNAVRFHKFSKHGMPVNISTNLTNEKYDKLDYFHAKLKEKGVYLSWSPIYGHKPRIDDSKKLIAYEEIKSYDLNNHLSGSTIGLVNFAEDVQDLHIELLTNMLNHKNPYTGLRYADDPALAFVEIQNEDNIYFATTERVIEQCPTYKKILTEKFTEWLLSEYDSEESLLKAWGDAAFVWGKEVKNINWDIKQRNITPVVNHGVYDYEFKKYQSLNKPMPKFLLDMARFLFEEQQKYYKRLEEAIRATGYKGIIIGSCWQAGSGISHYYNLFADHSIGTVDRHNYFGGGTGHTLKTGKFNNESMLAKPGSGLLSSGMQQISDNTFSISEWLSLVPNEWTAESSPIIAVYGMGLQGWDASFSFASDYPFFTNTLHTPGVYNVMSPLQLSLYPALSRMIYRGDISEGDIISVRNVNLDSLAEGKLGFNEIVSQKNDVKEIKGFVKQEALAAGRVVIDFTDQFIESKGIDLSPFIDYDQKVVKSSTDELVWDFNDNGYFTVNTEATQAFVGFNPNKKIQLNDIELTVDNKFAIIIVTTFESDHVISDSHRIFVTAISRAVNSGMEYNDDLTQLKSVGDSPILLEPIKFGITIPDRDIVEVNILDHTGSKTDRNIISDLHMVEIDGVSTGTLYYEILLN